MTRTVEGGEKKNRPSLYIDGDPDTSPLY